MVIASRVWCATLAFVLCVGCGDSRPTLVVPENGRRVVTRHLCQTQTKDGVKLEVWTHAGIRPVGSSLDLWIRLTSPDEKRERPSAKLRVRFERKEDKREVQTFDVNLEFKNCATLEKCEEVCYLGDGVYGPHTSFPPGELCWQANQEFKLGVEPFPPGVYVLQGEIIIDGHTKMQFEPRDFKTYRRGDL